MLDAGSSTARSVAPPPPPPPPPPRPAVAPATHAPVQPVAPTSGAQAAETMVRAATDPASGRIDTRVLAEQVAGAMRSDPAAASAAYAAIEAEVGRTGGVGDVGRLSADIQTAARALQPANNNTDGTVFGTTFTGATVPAANRLIDTGAQQLARGQALGAQGATQIGQGTAMTARGTQTLVDNPILTVRWEATQSAWTQQAGLSGPLEARLRAGGIEIALWSNLPPAGSVGQGQGLTRGQAANVNGRLAEQMIGDRYRADGFNVTTAPSAANTVQGGARVVDVVAERPNADPRMNERIETESKVGYTTNSGRPSREATNDIDRLANNRRLRDFGEGLEANGRTMTRAGEATVERGAGLARTGQVLGTVGRVARPVAIAMDVIEVGSAIRADGGVGENTGRTLSGLAGGAAGGWGGAAAGAAIGTAIFPGVGTVVGGVIGGIAGGLGGDAAGRGIFDTVRGWF